MSIEEYYQSQLAAVGLSPYVQTYDIELDKRGPRLGVIRGEVRFLDGSLLFFRELVDLEFEPVRIDDHPLPRWASMHRQIKKKVRQRRLLV